MRNAPNSASKEAKKSGERTTPSKTTERFVPYVVSPASPETIRKVLNITPRDSRVARQALIELGLATKQTSNR